MTKIRTTTPKEETELEYYERNTQNANRYILNPSFITCYGLCQYQN